MKNPERSSFSILENSNLLIYKENNNYQIKILNIMGESVLVTKTKEIDISRLPNGVYFLNFETDKFITSKKIIIQH